MAELAELWYRCEWRDEILPPEAMKCEGCQPGIWCRYEIPACAAAHDVPHCGACEEFLTCTTLQDMFIRNAIYKAYCEAVCTPDEFKLLRKTCFSKQANLEAARSEIEK